MRVPILKPYDEDAARRVARIIGEHSAVARALRELNERRERGEIAGLFKHGNSVVVFGINPPSNDLKG